MHNKVTFLVQALAVMHKKIAFCVHVLIGMHTEWQKMVFVNQAQGRISSSHAPASPAWTQVRGVSRTRQAWKFIPRPTVILPYALPRGSVGTRKKSTLSGISQKGLGYEGS